jgi:hypothetical protein
MTMSMTTLRGRVRGGHLQVDELVDLPDGTEVEVTVQADGGDGLDERERAALHRDLRLAMAEIDRGEDVPIEQVLAELDAARDA